RRARAATYPWAGCGGSCPPASGAREGCTGTGSAADNSPGDGGSATLWALVSKRFLEAVEGVSGRAVRLADDAGARSALVGIHAAAAAQLAGNRGLDGRRAPRWQEPHCCVDRRLSRLFPRP